MQVRGWMPEHGDVANGRSHLIRGVWSCIGLLYLLIALSALGQNQEIPHLLRDGEHIQLVVDGNPFLMLGGQARNSSASNLDDVEVVYKTLDALHANTAELPLSWSLLETAPGKFDFHLVDGAIEGARRHHLKLVFLWFGTTKNATFSYVPDWIKRDRTTYFRARDVRGEEMDAISPFCDAALKADQRAFSAIMHHIREFDGQEHTVVLMQVENETGLIRTDRDYSAVATHAFEAPVLSSLVAYLEANRDNLTAPLQSAWKQSGYRKSGTWTELFGDLAPEAFSAWCVSTYVDKVAEAGKQEYPIPYYINVALINTGAARPGEWPTGGATFHVLDIWKALATHIDIVAPDIYRTDFPEVASAYNRADNVLFVPETGFSPYYAPYAFTTFAENGIGFSPFGIDPGNSRNDADPGYEQKSGDPVSTHQGIEPAGPASSLEENYRVLRPLLPLIARNRYRGTLFPIVLGMYRHEAIAIPMGDSLTAVVHFDEKFVAETQAHRAGGIIVKLSPDSYIVAGEGFHVEWAELKGVPRNAEYLSIEEGTFDGDRWITKRALNGDEENTTLPLRRPRILQVRLNRTLK
jgi:beta-galactosidase GanA